MTQVVDVSVARPFPPKEGNGSATHEVIRGDDLSTADNHNNCALCEKSMIFLE